MNSSSILLSRPDPLGFGLVASLAGHATVGALVIAMAVLAPPSSPPVDPEDVMEVSMVVLPRSESSIPDRASKAPIPRGASPEAAAEPAPVRESDLSLPEPEVEPARGAPERHTSREELLRELEMQALLADAPDGPVDRSASDPHSTTEEAIHAAGVGTLGDPEWARYQQRLQQLFMSKFSILPTSSMSELVCVVNVQVQIRPEDDMARVVDVEVAEPSGNLSYDAAARRAAEAVRSVPLPPERFVHVLQRGFQVRFVPPQH